MSDIEDQAAALRRLVARLDDTAAVLGGVRDAVAAAWDDVAGREWSERLRLTHRAAERLAGDAASDAAALEHRAAGETGTGGGHDGAAGPGHDAGLRLPGHGGTRTTDRRGMVAPLLPPTDGGGRP